jgi:hypothetical protein
VKTDPLTKSKNNALASLMGMSGQESAGWSSGELGAILRHQLLAPLEYDLRTIAPGGERSIHDMTAAIISGPRPKSFADLICHPAPPIDLLNLMKDFARTGRDNGSLPAEVGTVLYYAAIALALRKQMTRITKLDDAALQKGIEWCLGLPWIDESLRQLFNPSQD